MRIIRRKTATTVGELREILKKMPEDAPLECELETTIEVCTLSDDSCTEVELVTIGGIDRADCIDDDDESDVHVDDEDEDD